jgi:FkbM family methyltransferase
MTAQAPFAAMRRLWGAALSRCPLRHRLVAVTKRNRFEDLDIWVPLGNGLRCPVISEDVWESFVEVFCRRSYAEVLAGTAWPGRWVDIGCHAGFFSLWLLWQRRLEGRPDGAALLVDADARMQLSLDRIRAGNGLEDRLRFVHGLVSDRTEAEFYLRDGMASSAIPLPSRRSRAVRVKAISAAEMLERFPPPYDLVKVDIEGGEYGFLRGYRPVLDAASRLLLEWHSWHPGGGGRAQLAELAAAAGFRLQRATLPASLQVEGKAETCGVELWSRAGLGGTDIG